MENYRLLSEYDVVMESSKWMKEIPYIKFKKEWLVKVVPPFAGAVCRFFIKNSEEQEGHVSVYLDCYDKLGFVGEPYWEIYPVDDDCYRVMMNDTKELIDIIEKSLSQL